MTTPEHPGALRAWLLATRPKTLLAGATPVFVGGAIAADAGGFAPGPFAAALAGSLLIQIGTNLANDFFDFRSGADAEDRLGPARATQQGWLTPRQVAVGAGLTLAAALAVGLYLVSVAGWPLLVIGLVSLALAVAYTGGPYPLAYHGLGDLFVLVFFGFVAVTGTTYALTLSWSPQALLAGLPVGLLATAILVVNNLRDHVSDARANKRTLAVRFGPRFARAEYAACVALAYAAPLLALALGWGPGWLLPWLTLPLALARVRAVFALDGAALNPCLGQTAALELAYGALLCVGVLVF